MRLDDIITIDSSWELFEAAYPGNLGLMEMMRFHQVADEEQKARMAEIVENKDWDAFKDLIHEVLGIRLL